MRAPNVLLTWEMGAGLTHLRHLAGVAKSLRMHGCDCRYATFRAEAAGFFDSAGIAALPVDAWPTVPRSPSRVSQPARGFVDTLANFGMGHEETLAARISWYDRRFADWRPDLVLGDYAYIARLAAHGRVPFVAIGCTSSTVPVVDGAPLGFEVEGPSWVWDPDGLTRTVNGALAATGRPPIQSTADIVRGEGTFCMAIPETDLYDGRRRDRLLPPMVPEFTPDLKGGSGEEIFVYLHAFTQSNLPLLAGIITCGFPVRLFLVDLNPDSAEALAAFGIVPEAKPVPVAEIVRRSRLVVHHGGGQMVALLLAAGVPQIVLSKHVDNVHCGRSTERLGVGRSMAHGEVTTPWIVEAIEDLMSDEVAARAAALAPTYRDYLAASPVPAIAATCLRLMGVSA